MFLDQSEVKWIEEDFLSKHFDLLNLIDENINHRKSEYLSIFTEHYGSISKSRRLLLEREADQHWANFANLNHWYGAYLLVLYSDFERYLANLCVMEEQVHNIKVRDLDGNGTWRSFKYLESVCNGVIPQELEKVTDLNKIRNFFAHNDGYDFVGKDEKSFAAFKRLSKNRKGAVRIYKYKWKGRRSYKVQLTKNFCEWASVTLRDFLILLYEINGAPLLGKEGMCICSVCNEQFETSLTACPKKQTHEKIVKRGRGWR